MNVTALLPYLQLILTTMNVCILVFAFYKFLNKPRTSLEEKVELHDVEIQGIKASLYHGNDRFRELDTTNEVIRTCMLALLDFELSYCIRTGYTDTADLGIVKDKLRSHLARRKGDMPYEEKEQS